MWLKQGDVYHPSTIFIGGINHSWGGYGIVSPMVRASQAWSTDESSGVEEATSPSKGLMGGMASMKLAHIHGDEKPTKLCC
jgi:hypothetical protein